MAKTLAASIGYALVGSLLGSLLFPRRASQKPEDIAGMKLSGPSPGTPLPILMGTRRVRGHVIWDGPITTHEGGGKKGGGGGKGGKGQGETTYTRSFIHALAEGEEAGNISLLRILSGDDILWDAVDPSYGQQSGINFTFYPGMQTDPVDPQIADYQLGGSGGSALTTTYTETATILAAGGAYTVAHPPVISGSDVVWYRRGGPVGQIVYLTRVGSSPGVDQYTINLTTGLITIGGLQETAVVTFRYQVATGTSAQEPLAYPNVCKIAVYEFNMGTTQTLPQLTYELGAAILVEGMLGVAGWAHAYLSPWIEDPPTFERNRFFEVREDGTYEMLGVWSDFPIGQGGEDPAQQGKWRVDGIVYHPTDQHWYVCARKRKGGLIWGMESAVFRTPSLPPPGTFDSPGAGVTRMAWTDFGPGEWSVEEMVWDPVVGPDGRVYFLRNVPSNLPVGQDLVSVDSMGNVEEPGSFGTTALCSITVHNGKIYAAGGIEFVPQHRLGYFDTATDLWTELAITFDSPPGNGPVSREDLRLESFGANRLYYSTYQGGKVYRFRESDNTMILQSGFSGAIYDFYADIPNGRLLGIGNGFIVSTPLASLTDAWTVLITGTGEVHAGLGNPGNGLVYFLAGNTGAGTSRVRRLNADSTVTTIATYPNDTTSRRSRMIAPGLMPLVANYDFSPDINLVDAVGRLISHPRYGGGLSSSIFHATSRLETRQYASDNDLRGSVLIENTVSLLQAVEQIMAHYLGWLAFVQSLLVFGARRPETVIREIVVEDALIERELTFALPGERDTKNRIRIDWTDRSRRYNTAPYYVGDDFDRTTRGERAENISLPYFCRSSPVVKMAAKYLYLHAIPQIGYEIALGPKEIALAPGDVVALTSAKLGVVQETVRIAAIGESEDRGEFVIQFVQEAAAALALDTFPVQPPNPGDPPISPIQPAGLSLLTVWEEPPEVSGEGTLRTMFIVAGTGNPNWRGASIYLSPDGGLSYQRVATYLGAGAAIGSLEGPLPAGESPWQDREAVGVSVLASAGQLVGTSRNNALALQSLALVRDEPVGFRDATLISTGRYTLRGFFRGPFEQARQAWVATDPLAFIGALPTFPTLDHPASRIGQTLYFKAASINQVGQEQDLAEAIAIPFTLQGLAQRPSPVYGLQLEIAAQKQGSRRIIGTGQLDIKMIWRYARRDNPEDADFVNGFESPAKEPAFLDYIVRIYTKATAGGSWGLRRTVIVTTEAHTYTAAQNIADNGAYHPFVRFDVTVRRFDGVESRVQRFDVEVIQ